MEGGRRVDGEMVSPEHYLRKASVELPLRIGGVSSHMVQIIM